jgi:hypothetical protein
MCHHIGVDDKMQILVHSEWWGEKNVPLEHILLSIKDAPKTEIDRAFYDCGSKPAAP